jgi:hypothetical protein
LVVAIDKIDDECMCRFMNNNSDDDDDDDA